MNKLEIVINDIFSIYKSKGFVTEDEVVELMTINNVSIKNIDIIMEKIIGLGVIFSDIESKKDQVIDKAQIDYEIIYDRIILISPSLGPLILYFRGVKPPQNREWISLIP